LTSGADKLSVSAGKATYGEPVTKPRKMRPSLLPLSIPDDETSHLDQEPATERRAARWQERAQLWGVARDKLILEEGQEIPGKDNREEDYGD
jgi:hypothetical protein